MSMGTERTDMHVYMQVGSSVTFKLLRRPRHSIIPAEVAPEQAPATVVGMDGAAKVCCMLYTADGSQVT